MKGTCNITKKKKKGKKILPSCAMTATITTIAVTRIRTWVVAATTRSTNHYTITAITAELYVSEEYNQFKHNKIHHHAGCCRYRVINMYHNTVRGASKNVNNSLSELVKEKHPRVVSVNYLLRYYYWLLSNYCAGPVK